MCLICFISVVMAYVFKKITYFLVFGCVACGILVPWPGIEQRPWQWKCRVLITGPPGNSPKITFWTACCWYKEVQLFFIFYFHHHFEKVSYISKILSEDFFLKIKAVIQVVKRDSFLSSFSISIVLNFIFLPFWLDYSIKSNMKWV